MIWHLFLLFAQMTSADDPQWIERLRQRDPDAMAELYDRFSRVVYSVIFRIVRNASVAEELAQEAFLRAWNRASAFDTARGGIGPWLLTIARNRAIDYLRSSAGQQQATTFELVSSERITLFVNTEDRMLDQEQARRIRAAFSKLNANQRQVLELERLQKRIGHETTFSQDCRATLGDPRRFLQTGFWRRSPRKSKTSFDPASRATGLRRAGRAGPFLAHWPRRLRRPCRRPLPV